MLTNLNLTFSPAGVPANNAEYLVALSVPVLTESPVFEVMSGFNGKLVRCDGTVFNGVIGSSDGSGFDRYEATVLGWAPLPR